MQIVSTVETIGMECQILFSMKKEKQFNMSSAENFTQR